MTRRRAVALLAFGAAAGLFYIVVGVAQMLTRDGFDIRRHALSVLSNGSLGWIQICNFIVSGVLVLLGAAGIRGLLRGRPAGTWAPLLLAVYGVGLIGAGIFKADPAAGFPPGSAAPSSISRSGLLHFVFGGIGFYGLIAACLVFARRFFRLQQRGRALYSAFSGVTFFLAFAAIASGTTSAVVLLAFYAAVAWIWVWHAWLHLTLLRESPD